jgi:hypothetical protein
MTGHLCPVAEANGAVDPTWCFDDFAAVLQDLPPILSESDVLVPELHLATEGPWSVYYCPFDWVSPKAKVVIVGITPGLQQSYLSNQEAQRALNEGVDADEALRRACTIGSFAGIMRTNLVRMLDGIGVQDHLDLASTAALFGEHDELLHSTSSLLYPVFRDGKNYGGSPDPTTSPLLTSFLRHVLPAELALVPEALVIPLGKMATAALARACARGALNPSRVLFDFPHPSGGNGHRERLYKRYKDALAERVASWPSPA